MMNWDGGWAWLWLMIPTMFAMWAVIAWLVLPWVRTNREQSGSPVARLDDRLAVGEISIEDYRARREELERQAPR